MKKSKGMKILKSKIFDLTHIPDFFCCHHLASNVVINWWLQNTNLPLAW